MFETELIEANSTERKEKYIPGSFGLDLTVTLSKRSSKTENADHRCTRVSNSNGQNNGDRNRFESKRIRCCLPKADLSNLAIPRLALPAPWNKKRLSLRGFSETRSAANIPATATEAVPIISSLNVLYCERCRNENLVNMLVRISKESLPLHCFVDITTSIGVHTLYWYFLMRR